MCNHKWVSLSITTAAKGGKQAIICINIGASSLAHHHATPSKVQCSSKGGGCLNKEGEIKGRFPGVVYCSSAAVQCTEEGGVSVSTKERGHNKCLRHVNNG